MLKQILNLRKFHYLKHLIKIIHQDINFVRETMKVFTLFSLSLRSKVSFCMCQSSYWQEAAPC